jgi:hypothetical protein
VGVGVGWYASECEWESGLVLEYYDNNDEAHTDGEAESLRDVATETGRRAD